MTDIGAGPGGGTASDEAWTTSANAGGRHRPLSHARVRATLGRVDVSVWPSSATGSGAEPIGGRLAHSVRSIPPASTAARPRISPRM